MKSPKTPAASQSRFFGVNKDFAFCAFVSICPAAIFGCLLLIR